jgi:hypothetical protein
LRSSSILPRLRGQVRDLCLKLCYQPPQPVKLRHPGTQFRDLRLTLGQQRPQPRIGSTQSGSIITNARRIRHAPQTPATTHGNQIEAHQASARNREQQLTQPETGATYLVTPSQANHDCQSLSWSWASVNSLVGRPSLLNQRFDGFSISTRIGVTRLVDLVTHIKSG